METAMTQSSSFSAPKTSLASIPSPNTSTTSKNVNADAHMVDVMSDSNANIDEDVEMSEKIEKSKPRSKPKPKKKKRRILLGTRKPFRCTICNYMTTVKARFTKHVKYHSMPLIKCEFCDFKTPYKWNLDRHYKNHNGDGSLPCPLCNFTCDIKQSLTVHIQNHHNSSQAKDLELLGLGKKGKLSNASDYLDMSYLSDSGELVQFSQGVSESSKMSANKRRNSSSPIQNRYTNMTDLSNRGKTLPQLQSMVGVNPIKCQYCIFKTSSQPDLVRHVSRCHRKKVKPVGMSLTEKQMPSLIPIPPSVQNETSVSKKISPLRRNSKTEEFNILHQLLQNKDDLRISTSSNSSPHHSLPHFEKYSGSESENEGKSTYKPPSSDYFSLQPNTIYSLGGLDKTGNKNNDCNLQSATNQPTTTATDYSKWAKRPIPRRRTSFFEKLTQKLVANSKSDPKSLNEPSSMNTITITSNSTRCQYCRQRCKSSLDLISHLGSCQEAKDYMEADNINMYEDEEDVNEEDEDEQEEANLDYESAIARHGNKIFVWNTEASANKKKEKVVKSGLQNNSELRSRLTEVENSDDDLDGYITAPVIKSIHSNNPESTATTTHPKQGQGDDEQMDVDSSVTTSRKVYKCPEQDCGFWATTASRFHVHVVGHYNLKPFECSQCSYRSNWRWDITKHIRLKSLRDSNHSKAKVLLTHESGQRNYRKYDRYLVSMDLKYAAHSKLPDCSTVASKRPDVELNPPSVVSSPACSPNLSLNPSATTTSAAATKKALSTNGSPKIKMPTLTKAPVGNLAGGGTFDGDHHITLGPLPILRPISSSGSPSTSQGTSSRTFVETKMLAGGEILQSILSDEDTDFEKKTLSLEEPAVKRRKRALWKCKKCAYRHPDKDKVLLHSREAHAEGITTISKESIGEDEQLQNYEGIKNPFSCGFCDIIMPSRRELLQHMKFHGSDALNQQIDGSDGIIAPEETPPKPRRTTKGGGVFKKYHCINCPYVTDSKGQFLYHKQFHIPREAPYKCSQCSYNVSHKHLLHQHIRVHGLSSPEHDDAEQCFLDDEEEDLTPLSTLTTTDRPTVLLWRKGKPFRMFRCQFCPKVFQDLDDLRFHEKEHDTERSLSPPREAINLTIHKRSDPVGKSPVMQEYVHMPSKSLLYFCSDCPARFFYEKELVIHRTFHFKKSDFKCEYCSYSARQQTPHLLSHMRVHSREYQVKSESLLLRYSRALTPITDQNEVTVSPVYASNVSNLGKRVSWLAPKSEITIEAVPAQAIHNPGSLLKPIKVPVPPLKSKQSGTDEIGYSGNPEFIYPTFIKNGKIKIKKYKCSKCPSAFEKRDQYRVHIGLHGSDQRYKCTVCDYAVTYYANYIQHVKKHASQPNVPPELLIVKPLSKCKVSKVIASTESVLICPDSNGSNSNSEASMHKVVENLIPETSKGESVSGTKMCVEQSLGLEKKNTSKCPFCEFSSFKKRALISHIRMHFKNTDN